MKNLIASISLACMGLLLAVTTAGAVNFSATASPSGGSITQGQTVTLQIFLNTEGQADIQLADVGLIYDDAVFQYNEQPSTMTSYMLYSAAVGKTIPARWLQPLPNHINGGSVDFYGGLDASPKVFLGNISGETPGPEDTLITTGYQTPDFGGTQVTGEGLLMTTIELQVLNSAVDGPALVELAMTSANIVQLATGPTNITNQVTLSGSFNYTVPEPGLALLGFTAIGTLSFLAARRRRSA